MATSVITARALDGSLAAFPIYLALRGAPSALEVAAFAWLIAPILLSWFLSRTGRYEGAHVLSSLSLTGLVAAVAYKTGGLSSFAAIFLATPVARNRCMARSLLVRPGRRATSVST